jgi:hypothetical protein
MVPCHVAYMYRSKVFKKSNDFEALVGFGFTLATFLKLKSPVCLPLTCLKVEHNIEVKFFG